MARLIDLWDRFNSRHLKQLDDCNRTELKEIFFEGALCTVLDGYITGLPDPEESWQKYAEKKIPVQYKHHDAKPIKNAYIAGIEAAISIIERSSDKAQKGLFLESSIDYKFFWLDIEEHYKKSRN